MGGSHGIYGQRVSMELFQLYLRLKKIDNANRNNYFFAKSSVRNKTTHIAIFEMTSRDSENMQKNTKTYCHS